MRGHASGRTNPCRPGAPRLAPGGYEAAKISVATIRRIESQEELLTGNVSTLLKIQAAFEQAGIQFIDEDETGGFGLRMAKKKRKR